MVMEKLQRMQQKTNKKGVDIVINFGFAGSITKSLKNGDIVFINKLLMKKRKLSTFKFDKDLLRNLEKNFKFFKKFTYCK